MEDGIIVIRGGGDIATGVIQKFHRSGFNVLVVETQKPTAIRRNVALCQCIYDGTATVEGMTAVKVNDISEIYDCFKAKQIPIIVDEKCDCVKKINTLAVIDAILAKRNLGTNKTMADITIGLGPGFLAGEDVDVVIETMRGHDLGRLIFKGGAMPNTGVPGEIGGKSKERVVHSPQAGVIKHISKIGDVVEQGQVMFYVDDKEVCSPFTGLIRGLIQEGLYVKNGMKVADIDPRTDVEWNSISDKARSIGGAALEAYLYLKNEVESI